eukprot:GGOE01009953.1.p1 GENE.GGOE01009953.1~~GGOE01009953.1.p1  ORF type:complete len:684 (-),score=147.01 GGOE01009953.1:1163-3016(-)
MLRHMRHAARQARYPALSISSVRYCPNSQQSIVQVSGYNASMSRADLSQLLQVMTQQSGIEYIEQDRFMHHMEVPNDPSYSKQWHYGAVQSGGVYKSGLTYGMNLPGAWDLVKGSAQIVVADVDTGITNHPDLNNMVVNGYDMISDVTTANDGDGRDADPSDPGDASGGEPSSWHGTHVIGTIGAQTNNGVGVASATWGVKIQAVRVLGVGGGYQSDINDGIRWAAGVPVSGAPANKNPSKVINLSLGGSGSCGQSDQEAIDAAIGAGAILVIAAGNDNTNTNNASPCNCKHVICVGSHGPSGQRASYSNYGAEVDLMAPGGDSSGSQAYMVYSTLNSGTKGPGSPSYGYMEGTSMATPHVSGLVALMASVDPALVQEEAESILKLTARPFPASSGSSKCDSTTCGAGLADATAAIKFMQARPVNDRCAAAVPLTCGSLVTGSTQYATALSADAPCGSTSATSVDVWYSLALSATTAVHLSTCQNDTTFNTQLAVYSGACSSLSCIAGQDDSPSCGTQTVLSVSLPAGTNLARSAWRSPATVPHCPLLRPPSAPPRWNRLPSPPNPPPSQPSPPLPRLPSSSPIRLVTRPACHPLCPVRSPLCPTQGSPAWPARQPP